MQLALQMYKRLSNLKSLIKYFYQGFFLLIHHTSIHKSQVAYVQFSFLIKPTSTNGFNLQQLHH
jgi:hypothetical protein